MLCVPYGRGLAREGRVPAAPVAGLWRAVSALLRLFALAGLALLGACASQAPLPAADPTLPLPLQLHIERQLAGQRQDWLLVIQREGGGIRWSMMDPLGIPQARQRLVDGRWQADGLLPPNPEARELFAALLFALTPSAELTHNYPAAQQGGGHRSLPARWDIRYAQPLSFELNLPQGPHYRVSPLGEPTP